MTDELRAAAQLIVDRENSHSGWWWEDESKGPATAATVAMAYLAEHPADDGESVTRDWLAESGWDVPSYWPAIKTPCGGFLEWRLTLCWIGVEPVAVVKTRGDVRRLLSALGITPK